ncbi:MAG TPA: hypothetical protein VJB02_00630 [Coxiellaceae bacterium]|nr:hypothetical protein [Coxiellaceae bacterium]
MATTFFRLTCLGSILLLSGFNGFKDKTVYPAGCKPIQASFQQGGWVLSPQPGDSSSPSSKLYVIYNDSQQALVLDRITASFPGAQAGWRSPIAPNRWSALMLNDSNFVLSCQKQQGTLVEQVNCKQKIRVCRIPMPVPASGTASGSYWLSESVSLSRLEKAIEHQNAP